MFNRTFYDELSDFRRAFDQVFDNFYNTSRRVGGADRAEFSFTPAVETGWTEDYLNLRVVLPGVTEKDLKMTVQGNQLSLTGERKLPEGFGKEGTIHNQMAYGNFERTLDLPHGLDLDKVQAHLHDGVLDIRIPVAQAVKPKQVPISGGKSDAKTLAA